MKFIVGVFVVVLAAALSKADLSPEQVTMLQNLKKECQEKTKVTDEDIALLADYKVPESQSGKCFDACIKKTMGIMDADNKVDMARLTDLMQAVKEKDEATYTAVMKVFNTCAPEVPGGPDECEVAGKLSDCIHREFKANDIKLNIFNP